MTIRLRVTWSNAGHALLPEAGANVTVQADRNAVPVLATSQPGLREFDVPSGVSRVVLMASFTASFGPVGAAKATSATVLSVAQRYDVKNGGAVIEPAVVPPFQQQHPLIDSKIAVNANGAIAAHIHTDFVDISSFWSNYTQTVQGQADTLEYQNDHLPGTTLAPLGFTGGRPLIWFASIPDSLVLAGSSQISTLVFYRPTNYNYSKIDQPHDQFPLNRYMLSPDPTAPPAKFWRSNVFLPNPQDQGNLWFWLRCGFEDALAKSGKPVVLLQPWPSAIDYGAAAGNRLPELANAALRFLWSRQRIAANKFNVRLGRLGLMGYSAGGDVLWNALVNNFSRVNEVYSFDSNHTGQQDSRLLTWFQTATSDGRDPRLFMAAGLGNNVLAGSRIAAKIQSAVQPPSGHVLSLPPSPASYLDNSIPHWVQVTGGKKSVQQNPNGLHQFPVFGRFPRTPSEPLNANPTFLQQFLELSGF